MTTVAVIIVSWNAKDHLRNCLQSIQTTAAALVRRIVVVDNASSDGSPEMVKAEFPEVQLLVADQNLGFARANNLGMQNVEESFVALVNSDVVVHPECFQVLARFLEQNQDVGLIGPKVVGANGKLQSSCGRLPTVWNTACEFLLLKKLAAIPFFAGFELSDIDRGEHRDVEVVSGCFWMARSQAIAEVGGLDESFFFYAEDVDWCRRFRTAGWRVSFVPEAVVTHFGGGSSANAPVRFSIEFLRANLLYWNKHHGFAGRAAFYVLALMQHSIRLVVRAALKFGGFARGKSEAAKLKEHAVCLRWLLTGREL